jgi:hypothetical protein
MVARGESLKCLKLKVVASPSFSGFRNPLKLIRKNTMANNKSCSASPEISGTRPYSKSLFNHEEHEVHEGI